MKNIKLIYLIDGILLLGTIGIILFSLFYLKPSLTSPEDKFTTTGAVLFNFEKGDKLYIDDNSKFTSPEIFVVSKDMLINLNPGTYYWKVEGILPSEIRQFTITSYVELRIRETRDGRGYELVNGGNERLNVDVYEGGSLTGSFILEREDEKNIENKPNKTYIGGKDG